MTVVVSVDGMGRTHRLEQLAAGAAAQVVRVGSVDDAAVLTSRLNTVNCLAVLDDAHLADPGVLLALAEAADRGVPVLIARRPTIDRPELAELDRAAAANGGVELLRPLDVAGTAGLIEKITGQPLAPERAADLHQASAGVPLVAAALAQVPPGARPPLLVARMQRRLALMPPATAELARILALRLDLADDELATAADLPPSTLAPAMRRLHEEGLLVADTERMIPALAEVLLGELSPAERRRLHDRVALALAEATDPLPAATQLLAARARTPVAVQAYVAAGERLRLTDPAAALDWFDEAADAGADPAVLAAGRAEAAILLGLPADLDGPVRQENQTRLVLVEGAAAAHQGRADRAAETLRRGSSPGPVLAVPALVATGRLADAKDAAGGAATQALLRLAEAALASTDPAAAVPLFIEAAESVEQQPPQLVLPDTPHALGALVAVTAGEPSTAENLLDRAIDGRVGGPAALDRHRLLLGWVRLRTGRYDTPAAELRRLEATQLPARERLLRSALAAGLARRSGDIARMRETWSAVEQVLARRAVDLSILEPLEELLVAGARLRRGQQLAPVLDLLDGIVERLGFPVAWAVALDWIRVQLAITDDDAAAVAELAERLERVAPTGPRQSAQCVAARQWASVLAGKVDVTAILAACADLAEAELPWEASRLAGQAAIRTADPAVARKLLERARELSNADGATTDGKPADGQAGTLSEREIEVARLVQDGRTHREIGAQLFISAKTVEHHVARIRTKLGATTRAELTAALREILDR